MLGGGGGGTRPDPSKSATLYGHPLWSRQILIPKTVHRNNNSNYSSIFQYTCCGRSSLIIAIKWYGAYCMEAELKTFGK